MPTQVVSSDECRALVFDDPANQSASRHAFDLMYFIIGKRLTLGRLTVADATNLKEDHRKALIRIAKSFHYNAAAIVFNVPVEVCLERNAARERKVPREALLNQYALLERTLRTAENEEFDYVRVLDEETQSSVVLRIGRYLSRRPPRQASGSESRA